MHEQGSDGNWKEDTEYYRSTRDSGRVVRARMAFLMISISFAVILFFSAFINGDRFLGVLPFPQMFSYLLSFICFMIFLGWLTYSYVQGGGLIAARVGSLRIQPDFEQFGDVLERIGKIESEVSSISDQLTGNGLASRDLLIEQTVDVIKARAREQIWSELSESVSSSAYQAKALAPIEKEYSNAKERLSQEIVALGKRGSVNLALGVMTTFTALLILASLALSTISSEFYNAFVASIKQAEFAAIAILFIPKISLAFFVQVFSLFFLKLYKSGLAEIKYFQNELTNLELKYFGIVASVLTEDRAAIGEAARLLLAVERNHILSNGQTTVELEKHKIEQSSSAEIFKLLPKLFNKK
jgi:energy-coupling factor transporter transmembrane protein EcfT